MAVIIYFGQVAELAGKEREELKLSNKNIAELKKQLEETIFNLGTIPYQIAVNQSLENDDFVLTNDMEIAVLPPFAGG